MEHIEAAHISLDRYFSLLSVAGSYPKQGVRKLMLYSFLVDTILDGELGEYLDDDGLLLINRLLACLSRNPCLSVVQDTHTRISKPQGSKRHLRISELGKIRQTESDELRTTETHRN